MNLNQLEGMFKSIKLLIDYVLVKWQRTYLAGCAMQGLLSSDPEGNLTYAKLVEHSIGCTDALIKELDKGDK